ncbi:MAG TPA: ATP-binding protein [Abditibacterium sp.]|jgi:signal transduction histidine kinase/HAMP domain-containing protein
MKSLRTQLLASHLALVALMALVMLGAVANFFRLGASIDTILRDNLKSAVAAQKMKESLERQDSAATFFLAGQTERARAQWRRNVPIFEQNLEIERNNITETGEKAVADAIASGFPPYKADVADLFNTARDSNAARAFYFSRLEPQFLKLKSQSQRILDINQAAIVRANERAKSQARSGALIGVAMTLAALGLAIVFARAAINSALTPLLALVQEAEQIGAGHLNRKIELRRDDEIGLLATAFNGMTERLRVARQKEQQRLHRAQQMSDAALENLFDPVLVTDATGTIVHLNKAAQGVFGPVSQLSGQLVSRVIHDLKIAAAIEGAIRQETTSAEEGEAGFVTLGEAEKARVYRLRATPMRDDETLLGAALVLEDVTHLRALDRLKTEFISVASHELRTPVTSLLLSAQLLDEGAVGELSEDQKEVVRAQREDLARLDALLRDLLDMTKLEAGATPPRFEWIAPRELIQTAARGVQSEANAKQIHLGTFSRDDLPLVRADRLQIGRVLTNLLNNAIRHTPESGEIRLEAALKDGKVEFRVCDSGAGIPPQYLERIFERFAQVPGATRGGAGLGLPISQTIVSAHGGVIRVESEEGKGSTFEFELEAQSEVEAMK